MELRLSLEAVVFSAHSKKFVREALFRLSAPCPGRSPGSFDDD